MRNFRRLICVLFLFLITYQMQADFPRDSNDFYHLNISNLTLHCGTDTLFAYPKRQYNCNRKFYFSGIYDKTNQSFNYGIFDRDGKKIVDMGTKIFRGGAFNCFDYIDSLNKNHYVILDSVVVELNDDNYYDYPKNNWISPKESDSICSKIANSVFDSPFSYFAITDDAKYICVTKRLGDSLSYILYNRGIIDSISNYYEIDKNKKKSFKSCLFNNEFCVGKDTLFYISTYDKHFNFNSGYLDYLEIHSIFNGTTKLISDGSEIKKYISTLKLPISNWLGDIYDGALQIIAKIDNTIILYYRPTERYFFYDYINKKFFDPVIKVIND